MRDVPITDYEQKELERLQAEPWMVDMLKLNPSYNSWGPGEDYMYGKDRGWSSSMETENWESFDLTLDDLNEVVNFHFEIERDSIQCEKCGGTGLNEESYQIERDFYDFDGDGSRKWCDKITQDEVQALWDDGRLQHDFKNGIPTADDVNEWERNPDLGSLGHDAINRWTLIKTRCKRLGIYGHCPHCEDGRVYTRVKARLSLVLWVLHPRKGASRGWTIKWISKEDLPEVFKFLREAADRNAARFQKISDMARMSV